MKERRLAREVAMQILFQWESQGVITRDHAIAPVAVINFAIEGFLEQFLSIFYVKPEKIDRGFAFMLLKGTVPSLKTIDTLIEGASTKWKLSRMDAIDRAILRLSCFELAIKKDNDPKVVINEAIEIAKRYGSEQSAAFVNGILNNIYVQILKP